MSKHLNKQIRDAYIAGSFDGFYLYNHLTVAVRNCQKIVKYISDNRVATNRDLSKYTGLSLSVVDRYCNSLVKLGLIDLVRIRVSGSPVLVKHYKPNTKMI